MPFGNLVPVRTFVDSLAAEVAKTALEAAGIDCLVRRDDCGGVRPSLWLGGIDVLVREDDLGIADEILATTARPRLTLVK